MRMRFVPMRAKSAASWPSVAGSSAPRSCSTGRRATVLMPATARFLSMVALRRPRFRPMRPIPWPRSLSKRIFSWGFSSKPACAAIARRSMAVGAAVPAPATRSRTSTFSRSTRRCGRRRVLRSRRDSEGPMSQPRVLFVCHNHPDLHPGGTEIFSHGLFQAMKSQHGIEAVYLACVNTVHRLRLPGTLLQSAGPAADEILLWAGHFDRFTLSQVDLHGIVPEFERLLLAFRPDIVHFHHVLLMGIEALQVVRRVLPNAGIVLTLHDYYPICANDGQMVTTRDRKLCRTASADSCAACFPETSRDRFVMRELFIKQNLSLVDRFISPSEFLKRRYVDWGLPEDGIDVVRNGIRDAEAMPHRPLPPGAKRDRFAFFGHLNPFKGGLVAIDAAKRLAQKTGVAPSLTLHGSADFQTDAFKAELAKASDNVPFIITRGRYTRDELPALMAEVDWVIMPSIWWENAPLI